MYLSDIKRDDRFEGYLIVRSAEQRASANGKNYLDMTLADKSGSINAKMWDGTVQPPLAGSIVKVRATGNEFNGRMQLRVEKIRAAESRDAVDMSTLIPCAPRDPKEMLDEVVRAADHIADPDLRKITCELLDRAGDKLLTFPAAKQMHHAERSGLLHHTTTMLRAANAIMSVYPQLNASLLIAGVIVHDLAKIDEMDADTRRGQHPARRRKDEGEPRQGAAASAHGALPPRHSRIRQPACAEVPGGRGAQHHRHPRRAPV